MDDGWTEVCKDLENTLNEEIHGVLTRAFVKVFLENVVRDAVTYTMRAKRKMVTAMDMVYTLKKQGRQKRQAHLKRKGRTLFPFSWLDRPVVIN